MNDKEIRVTIAEYIKELAKIKNNNANKAYTLSKTVANFMNSKW